MEQETPRKPAADGISIIPTTSDTFLRAWLEVMRPLHGLAPSEMDFAAVLLAKREEIAKDVRDPGMIDKILFEGETRKQLMELAGVKKAHMDTILHKLRKSGVIEGRRVNPTFIPAWTRGKPFRMVFIFKNDDT